MAEGRTGKSRFFQLGKRAFRMLGYHSDRQILAIESDDWGAIRVPSAKALANLRRRYPELELDHYQSYDTLDSAEDVEMLIDTLLNHESRLGEIPVITMNFAMANPLFAHGNETLGSVFEWETISHTYVERFGGFPTTIDVVGRAARGVLRPQLHGREHLNVTTWRRGIARGGHLAYAYGLRMVGLDKGKYCGLDALNKNNTEVEHGEYLSDALRLFEETFGFCPESFISPCYVVNRLEEEMLASLRFRTLQGGWLTNRTTNNGKLLRLPTIMGINTRYGLTRLVRNCQLEPAWWYHRGLPQEECVRKALRYVEEAFDSGQPAVVCSHRVNYVGGVDPACRKYGLSCLDAFLSEVTKRWPEVTFMASDELGAYIRGSGKHE